MVEDSLKLEGQSNKRPVVIVRKRIRDGVTCERRDERGQLSLELADMGVREGGRLWEYTVPVTDVVYPLEAVAQLYRKRCDRENSFDN